MPNLTIDKISQVQYDEQSNSATGSGVASG